MDYYFLALLFICIVVGFVIIRYIEPIAQYAPLITLLATIMTVASLTYTTGKTVSYNPVAESASSISPKDVDTACGQKNTENTLCYQEMEYRGYPFRMLAIRHSPDAEPAVTLARAGSRYGTGVVNNYAIYVASITLLALFITKIRRIK